MSGTSIASSAPQGNQDNRLGIVCRGASAEIAEIRSLCRFCFWDWRWVMANCGEWKAKYRSVMFETNRRALPKEIAEAENAIIVRARELFQKTGGDADAEREELDEVLYTLQAFRSVLGNVAA